MQDHPVGYPFETTKGKASASGKNPSKANLINETDNFY